MSKQRAALEGANEIYFAVIATSITLAVVFMPIIFLEVCRSAVPGIWLRRRRRGVGIVFCFAHTHPGIECKAYA